jgi:hypothetical protein
MIYEREIVLDGLHCQVYAIANPAIIRDAGVPDLQG